MNILRGTGAALVASGRNYAMAEQASTVSGAPAATVRFTAPLPYELPAVTGSLVESDPPPAEWLQIVGLLESLAGGCEWPRGNIARIQEMRDAFNDLAGTLDGVGKSLADQTQAVTRSNSGLAAEEFASFASLLHGGGGGAGMTQQLAAECRGLAGFCDALDREVQAAVLRYGWSAEFLIGTYVAMQVLASFTAVVEVAFLSVAETEAAGLRAFLLECASRCSSAPVRRWHGHGRATRPPEYRCPDGVRRG